MVELLINNKNSIGALCKEHQVDRLYVFGSAANGQMKADSDIDLLVQFSKAVELLDYADNFFSLQFKLQSLLQRKIDLLTVNSVKNEILIDAIDRSKIELYAAETPKVFT
ncbi:MAG: nucleotidyltransferase domain-containing protein [Leeuwenhoekiella sp.]